MADCYRGLLKLVYRGDIDSLNETQRAEDKGFRTAPLIRFVSKEDGLLAYTGDSPRIYLNIEDYVFYNNPTGRSSNTRFKEVVGYLRSAPACGGGGLYGKGGARLHWGKAGAWVGRQVPWDVSSLICSLSGSAIDAPQLYSHPQAYP